MYSVLLVDDEPSVLTGLRYVIDWDEYGVEIAGTASNGTQALELLRELPFYLETPNDLDGYAREIALLRSLQQ